jgi:hypothetical protein
MREPNRTIAWTAALVLAALSAGCPSPEAKRGQGGEPGADVGNRDRDGSVELHGERPDPYRKTPKVSSPR